MEERMEDFHKPCGSVQLLEEGVLWSAAAIRGGGIRRT